MLKKVKGYYDGIVGIYLNKEVVILSLVSVVGNTKWIVINERRIVIFHTCITMSLKKYVKLALLRS